MPQIKKQEIDLIPSFVFPEMFYMSFDNCSDVYVLDGAL